MKKSWKTSLAGTIAILTGVSACLTKITAGELPDMACVSAIVGGVGLIFSKDHDVTGGTKRQ